MGQATSERILFLQEAKEILKDEDLGRTRSADPEIAAAVSKEVSLASNLALPVNN